jgi:hypothetical protein
MKKTRKNPPPPNRMPSRKTLGYAALVAVVLFAGVLGTVWLRIRQPALRVDRILAAYQKETHQGDVSILYPLDQTVFPPEIVAPTFRWEDSRADVQVWLVVIDLPDQGLRMSFPCDVAEWTPAASDWQAIKRRSLEKPAKVTVLGINRDRGDAIVSAASISISTTHDEVGAPIFYREVDLPFLDAVRDPAKHIRWRFGSVDSPNPPPSFWTTCRCAPIAIPFPVTAKPWAWTSITATTAGPTSCGRSRGT